MSLNILIVEDDKDINEIATSFLVKAGYEVESVLDGECAMEQIRMKQYDLLVLDIMLPKVDGMTILKELRKDNDVPVLMITALNDVNYQRNAFSEKVDDFIVKPFPMDILVSRVEAILRRVGKLKDEVKLGKVTLLINDRKAIYQEQEVNFTKKEFEIIHILYQNRGHVVTRERLIELLWGYDFEGDENILNVHMTKIRKKIPLDQVKTIKGVGYRMENCVDEK